MRRFAKGVEKRALRWEHCLYIISMCATFRVYLYYYVCIGKCASASGLESSSGGQLYLCGVLSSEVTTNLLAGLATHVCFSPSFSPSHFSFLTAQLFCPINLFVDLYVLLNHTCSSFSPSHKIESAFDNESNKNNEKRALLFGSD